MVVGVNQALGVAGTILERAGDQVLSYAHFARNGDEVMTLRRCTSC